MPEKKARFQTIRKQNHEIDRFPNLSLSRSVKITTSIRSQKIISLLRIGKETCFFPIYFDSNDFIHLLESMRNPQKIHKIESNLKFYPDKYASL